MSGPRPVSVALTGDTSALDAALARAKTNVGQVGTQVESKLKGSTIQMDRFRGGLVTLASQATGTNTALTQLVGVASMFAVGSAMTVGVLGGLAALGFAWRRLTEDQKAYNEVITQTAEELDALIQKQAFGAKFPFLQQQANARAQMELLSEQMAPKRALQQRAIDEDIPGLFDAMAKELAPLQEQFDKWAARVAAAQTEIEKIDTAAAATATKAAESITELNNKIALLSIVAEQQAAAVEQAVMNTMLTGAAGKGVDLGQLDLSGRLDAQGGRGGNFDARLLSRRAGVGGAAGGSQNLFGRPGDFAVDLRSAARSFQPIEAAQEFDQAGRIFASSMGAMAEAAILGGNQVANAMIGALQSIIANIQTSSGGLFGSTLPGALIGVGLGIVGAFLNRGSREPARVHLSGVDDAAARRLAEAANQRPINVRQIIVTPEGRTVEETEYVLRNREARDGVPRYTGPR